MLVDSLLNEVLDVAEDVRAGVRATEHLLPLLVDDLALLVHHVVVLDHVLAGVEVHALDLLLRARDGAGDPRVLDRLDLEAVHQAADAVRGRTEDLHHGLLERDEKAAPARSALSSCATSPLVVDPPRFLALGTDDVQPAPIGDAPAPTDVPAARGPV